MPTRDEAIVRISARYRELFTSLDYGAIEQRVIAASLQQDDSDADTQRVAITPNPWPFDPQANLKLTQEDFIMSAHNHHFIVNRIAHTALEEHLDRLLEQYREGTAEGDDLKARFDVTSALTIRDEETAAKFQERCAFLSACYASKSFPPHRDMLKNHVLSMLTAATRDALGAYGVYAASANGNGGAVLDTGRAAVFKELEDVVRSRVETTPGAAPSSLTFYRDAPPADWVEADRLGNFIHDKQANDADLRREKALVESLDVGDDVKMLMRMYLTRAGNNYANALRYYHTSSLLNVFRNHADNYALLLFYTYEERGTVVRGLQYGVDADDYIEGFGSR